MREQRVQMVTNSYRGYLSPKSMLEREKTLTVGEVIDFLKKCDRNLTVEILEIDVGSLQYYPIKYIDMVNEEVK